MRVTTRDVRAKKKSGDKLVMVTAYDAPTGRIVDEAGVDMILVGDSVGTNVLGLDSETRVTLDDVIHHAQAVARSAHNALLVGDLPFMTFRVSTEQALAASARMIQEGRVQAVKLEGGAEVAGRVEAITTAGIPVMGHVGLTPQSVNELGGYRAQGRDSKGARAVVDGALALESAGAFAIVLESIPHRLAGWITERIGVPTIGIGAGPLLRRAGPGYPRHRGLESRLSAQARQAIRKRGGGISEGRYGLRRGGARRVVSHRAAQLPHTGFRDERAAGVTHAPNHFEDAGRPDHSARKRPTPRDIRVKVLRSRGYSLAREVNIRYTAGGLEGEESPCPHQLRKWKCSTLRISTLSCRSKARGCLRC